MSVAYGASLTRTLQSGEVAAFEELVASYEGPITGYLYQLVRDWGEAQDLAQETFLEAHRSLGALANNEKIRPWLYRIATHNALDYLRRRRLLSWLLTPWRRARREAAKKDLYGNTEGTVLLRSQVEEALEKLPQEYAACLLLHDLEGLSHGEVGQVLGLSVNTSRQRLARARRMFRAAFDAASGEESDVVT